MQEILVSILLVQVIVGLCFGLIYFAKELFLFLKKH